MFVKKFPLLYFLSILLLGACKPPELTEYTSSAPIVGPVISVGEPETRDLSPTSEVVSNCGTGGGTVIKHPSMTVLTNYAVEWEVGGSTGVGITIGEGVIPAGVDLSSALEGHYASQFDQGIQQATAWDLPAEPNEIVEYTLMWREVWQPGIIEITLEDQSVLKVNVRYRIAIQSDIVGKRANLCDDESAIELRPTSPPAVISQPTMTSPSMTICDGTGSIPPLPLAPPEGCILILEWWISPSTDGSDCGILITKYEPSSISTDAIGTWWYVHPDRPNSHLEGFQAKNPHCGVQDSR